MVERLAVACIGVLLVTGCSSGSSRAREMGCAAHPDPRTVQICDAIADEMEFQLMGHAVPAPGYKITAQTVVRVYCRLGLTKNDEAAIAQLRAGGGAAEELLQLVGVRTADSNNIFNPQHPQYVLKHGCPAR